MLAQLTKRLVERALQAELSEHLGYEPHREPPGGVGNTRNGSSGKTLRPSTGRCGSRRRGTATAASSRSSSARASGASTASTRRSSRSTGAACRRRDIEAHLAELYGVSVGRDLISRVTDAVIEDVREWQTRPLEELYPIVFLDALVLKIREGGAVQRKACYIALGVTLEGDRDVLGLWFQDNEGAKFWMQVLNDLKQRGVNDILICCVDGLKGFPEAIEAIYPQTVVQTCIVHLIRHSLKYVPRREREQVARDLKPVYTAVNADAAQAALEAFDQKWGTRFPVITNAWLNAWEHVTPFLAFPDEVRRVIYTTNAIEALNRQLQEGDQDERTLPQRGRRQEADLPLDQQRRAGLDANPNWTAALLAFKIHFNDRLPE